MYTPYYNEFKGVKSVKQTCTISCSISCCHAWQVCFIITHFRYKQSCLNIHHLSPFLNSIFLYLSSSLYRWRMLSYLSLAHPHKKKSSTVKFVNPSSYLMPDCNFCDVWNIIYRLKCTFCVCMVCLGYCI